VPTTLSVLPVSKVDLNDIPASISRYATPSFVHNFDAPYRFNDMMLINTKLIVFALEVIHAPPDHPFNQHYFPFHLASPFFMGVSLAFFGNLFLPKLGE
tara:strand:- start:42 stop:338 length:297 start_codon:yes stop_codon:yes gene_type:complete